MSRHLRSRFVALALGLACVYAPRTDAQSEFSLALDVEYTRGDYGASETTDILYVPVTAGLRSGWNAIKLTVPYIRVTAPAGGVAVGVDHMGRPIRRGTRLTRATESGLGDIEAAYGRTLLDDLDLGARVDAVAKVKLGTADETRGLGTGENDYSAQFDWYQETGSFTLLGTLGYRVLGDPPESEFANVWFGALGASYRVGSRGAFGLVYDYRQAATPASDAQKELRLYLRGATEQRWQLEAYLIRGMGNSSPDRGLGLLCTRGY